MFSHNYFGYLIDYPNKTIIDLTGLDTLNVESFDSMFMGCTNFINPIGWDPDKYIQQNYLIHTMVQQ